MTPHTGLIFDHAHWLDEANRPLRMKVTRIARGTVYYRPVAGGAPCCCDLAEFPKYARPATATETV